jgi:hypothetical protein
MGKNTSECQDYIIENLGSHSARSGAFQAPL